MIALKLKTFLGCLAVVASIVGYQAATVAADPFQDGDEGHVGRTYSGSFSSHKPGPRFPMMDTKRFVFGYPKSTHGFHGGKQLFGTMDKVGVYLPLHEQFPDLKVDLDAIEAAKPDRIELLKSNDLAPRSDMHWNISVFELKQVDGKLCYVVNAKVGSDIIRPLHSRVKPNFAIINELWEKKVDAKPILIKRDLHWSWRVDFGGTP